MKNFACVNEKFCRVCTELKPLFKYGVRDRRPSRVTVVCSACVAAERRAYRKNNVERVREQERARPNKKERNEWVRQWRLRNPHLKKAYLQKNKKRILTRQRHRRATIPTIRIRSNLCRRLNYFLRREASPKKGSIVGVIGCSLDNLKRRLESLFLPGMTWENYGLKGWHIDHIRPCASFDLTDPKDQKKCFHYTNLQPLWAVDNLRKQAKYPYAPHA